MLRLKCNPVEPASLYKKKERIPHMNASRVSACHMNGCVIMGSKIISMNSIAHDDTNMIYCSHGFTASKVFNNGIKQTICEICTRYFRLAKEETRGTEDNGSCLSESELCGG